MKKLSVLVPAAIAGVLVSAMVFAAPLSGKSEASSSSVMDRAEAYRLASEL